MTNYTAKHRPEIAAAVYAALDAERYVTADEIAERTTLSSDTVLEVLGSMVADYTAYNRRRDGTDLEEYRLAPLWSNADELHKAIVERGFEQPLSGALFGLVAQVRDMGINSLRFAATRERVPRHSVSFAGRADDLERALDRLTTALLETPKADA
jgi:hypothetical protein